MYSSNPYGKSAKLYSILSILMKYDVVERIDQTRLISRISGPYTKLIVRGKINSIPTQEIVQPNNFQQSDMADKFLADNNGMLSEAAIVVHFYNTYDRLEIWIKNE